MQSFWYVLGPALAAAPVVGAWALYHLEERRLRPRWQRFVEQLQGGGFALRPGSNRLSWGAEGTWDGVRFAVETSTETLGKTRVTRTEIRCLDATPRQDALVRRSNEGPIVPSLPEVDAESPLGGRYRIFARDAGDLHAWLGPSTRRLIDELDAIELRLHEGRLTLTLPAFLCEAVDVLRAVELLSCIQLGREPRADALGFYVKAGWSTPGTTVLYGALLIGFFGGIVLPVVPGLPSLASAVACEQGELKMVWSRNSRGKSGGNLYCVTARGREGATMQTLLLSINVAFWSAALGLSLRAARKPKEPYGERELPPRAPKTYR